MTFDLALPALAAFAVVLAWRAGVPRAAIGVLLVLGAVIAGLLLGPIAGLAGLAIWAAGALRFSLGRATNAGGAPGLAIGLGLAQAALVALLLPGLLLAGPYRNVPDAAEALRSATLYRVVHAIGAALPPAARNGALAFPTPVTATRETRTPPPRVIDWAKVSASDGTFIRTLPGELRAAERTPLAFEVEGRISEITVTIGDHFEAGDILARIDTHLLELALQEREAALIEATARLDEARQALERQKALFERGVVAETVLESATASLDAALSRQRVAQAGIDQAEDRLADATLHAPYAGSVAARLAEPAQTVRAGEPVLDIQSNGGSFEVAVTVPATIISKLRLGTEHKIRLLDGSNTTLTAKLTEIGARATGSSGFPVSLSLSDGTGQLRSGTSVEAALLLREATPRSDALSVPIQALLMGEGPARYVFVFDRATGMLDRRAVTLTRTEGQTALISKGLSRGEIVATRGVPFLSDGMAVTLRDTGITRYDD
ncbi:efflux RND transporter periplasmic adaptor subunit [Roseovarius aestuariivivens]|uniref:efflux RND transporter periplasmic adaptor subunit n=1 Tax=Roseovarius aestuariivivens TaxID=1888910 RepID=UPI0010810B0A|nr:efflux RND transporter periplasmic adaptor subunit [Roseovarius aestuariivivens]